MVPKRNQYDKKDCLEIGTKAENIFARLAAQKGWKVIKAPSNSNINEHWDFLIEKDERKYRIDVKAMKRISRKDKNLQDEWIWVELHGVRGDDQGWLYAGKADLIAIEKRQSFLIVKREDLIKLVEKIVDFKSEVAAAKEAKYKIYRRKERPDKLSLIESEKVKSIRYFEWEK